MSRSPLNTSNSATLRLHDSMTVVNDTLSEIDINVLARMHIATLPESLVSVIGERYALAFYRYLCESRDEALFLDRNGPTGTEVIGACIVSLHPETLNRRLLKHTPLVPMALIALRNLAAKYWQGKHHMAQAEVSCEQPLGPEIILIFTLPTVRNQGCGARLLLKSELWLAAHGTNKLYVKTRDAPDNRAIAFYQRAGYQRMGPIIKSGKQLVLFDKAL